MKANQAKLLEAAEWVFDPQLPADPSQTLPEWVGFPGLKQLVVVEREVYDRRTRNLKQSRSHALTSLDWEAVRLGWLVRQRWGIENHDFLVRDVTFAEDRCLVRGQAPLGLAHLRGFAINCLRQWQVFNLTVAIERFAAKPFELLARLGVV